MANINNAISKNLLDNILPTFGNPRVNIPVWDNSQRMFICEEYESASGNYYYSGVRFCDRLVIREKVGLFHNWTYIDSLELYAFNGKKMELVQKRDYDKEFRNEEFIRQESLEILKDFLTAVLKAQGSPIDPEAVETRAKEIVELQHPSRPDSPRSESITKPSHKQKTHKKTTNPKPQKL